MNLVEKLVKITEELKGGIAKKGKVRGTISYSYAKGEDAMKQFRELEVKYGVKVITNVVSDSLTTVEKAGKGYLTTFIASYTIINMEDTKDTLEVTIPCQGYDATDKGVYKALTGGFKYFIMQTFSCSSDDPEKATKKNLPGVGKFPN